jgi:hypothetical protein
LEIRAKPWNYGFGQKRRFDFSMLFGAICSALPPWFSGEFQNHTGTGPGEAHDKRHWLGALACNHRQQAKDVQP